MKLIGLCGRSGSGKSECGKIACEMGFAVIDCDVVYAELTQKGSPLIEKLAQTFGRNVVKADGELDRKTLSGVVFGDKEKLQILNDITHGAILAEVLKKAEILSPESKGNIVIVQAPLLFESGFDKKCIYNVCVISSLESGIERLKKRDLLTEDQAKARLASQLDNEFLRSKCDFVIENDGDISSLKNNTKRVFDRIFDLLNTDNRRK